MRRVVWTCIAFAVAFVVFVLGALHYAEAATEDPRFCGVPEREADGTIARGGKVLRDFQRLYPCPATGKRSGPCPGWAIDHVIPLACGGCDEIGNLAWMPNAIKRCAGDECKDRWERRVYGGRGISRGCP